MFIDPQVINTTAFLTKNNQHVGTVFFIRVGLRGLDLFLKGRASQHYAVTVSHCVPNEGIDIQWPESARQNPTPTSGTDWHRNDGVDLAVLPLAFDPANYGLKPLPFNRFVVHPKDQAKALKEERYGNPTVHECNIGAEVFTTGLFHGDDMYPVVSKPIVRFGHISLSPASNENIIIENRFGDGIEIQGPLVEMAVWKGQSGSPIFYQDRPHEPLEGWREYENTFLLGVAQGFYAGHQDVKLNGADVTLQGLGMGISVVIPSSHIVEILMRPKLVEERERTFQKILKDNVCSAPLK